MGLNHAESVLAHPLAVDDGEGLMVALAQAQDRGLPLYSPLDEEPYVANIYPPVFTRLMVWLRVPARSFLRAGRWASLAGAALSALALVWLAVSMGHGPFLSRILGGLAAALIFLNDPETLYWGCVARVDVLGLGLELLGLAVLLARPHRRAWNGAALALFLLAGFTKQSLVAGVITGFFVLFLSERKRALLFGAAFVGSGALLLGSLVVATKGLAWEHLVVANHITWSPQLVLYWWKVYFARHWGLVALAAASVVILVRCGTTARPGARGAVLFGVLALTASFTSGRLGSNTNHFLEATAALTLLVGLASSTLAARNGRAALLLSIPALLAILPFRGGLRLPSEEGAWWMGPTPASRENARQLSEALRGIPGDILSSHLDLAPLTGKRLLYQTAVMAELAKRGLWDPAPLVDRIRRKTFSVVILDSPIDEIDAATDVRFPPEVLIAIRRAYVLRMQRGVYCFHIPRP